MTALSNSSTMHSVTIVEVGPRDGFQAIVPFIETATKIELIGGLIGAGYKRLEIGSFVSPRAIPQMADIRSVMTAFQGVENPALAVLVPNARGVEHALQAGAKHLVYVISASETHNRRNVSRSIGQSLSDFASTMREVGGDVRLRFNLATAFDCPFEGTTPLKQVLRIVSEVLQHRPDAEICLCDTTGKASPTEVSRAFESCLDEFPNTTFAYHGHDTYGMGVSSSWAAYCAGVRIFDASVAGLGGCPFAPGATGNVASEDLVFMFEQSGISTGIDLPKLVEQALQAAAIEGAVTGGAIRKVLGRPTEHVRACPAA